MGGARLQLGNTSRNPTLQPHLEEPLFMNDVGIYSLLGSFSDDEEQKIVD